MKLLKIPLLATAVYFAVFLYASLTQFGFFSLVEKTSINIKEINEHDVHLLKDTKIVATFTASKNNLGILLIELLKFGSGKDNLIFRIKKEGAEEWYHESEFFGGQIQNSKYFPLGFPPIADSKNNTYIFEIESLKGKYDNGIGITKNKPVELMYKYSTDDLKNYRNLLSFTYGKSIYAFQMVNYWKVAIVFVISSFFAFFVKKIRLIEKKTIAKIIGVLLNFKAKSWKFFKLVIKKAKSIYLFQSKKTKHLLKKTSRWFTSTKAYQYLLSTHRKKRLAISLIIFLFALIYRFSSSLVNQDLLFYAGLGGQGDYDQFIRAATCAITNFCPAILGQNFLIESSILGIFYEIFGFTGGLKAYVYLMITLSSIVATLPYILLSRKSWLTLGGIVGSLFLAASDFLTHVSLNFPPDNGSLFTFSMFYLVYFITLQRANIRWLLFFGLAGVIDGLNKALFLINDLSAFILFTPVFFYEKTKIKLLPINKQIKSLFQKKSIKILFLSLIPLLVFLILYSAWEYIVYIKFSAYYFLRGLILSRGSSYVSYTSFDDNAFTANTAPQLFYLSISAIVMVKRLIEYVGLNIFFLAPIFLSMFLLTFVKKKFPTKKFLLTAGFSAAIIMLLILIRENFFNIHEIFAGEYIPFNWKTQTYVWAYLFFAVIFLFILNFKYSALKLSLPILPYVVMLIILTKNSPFPRISTHVVAWNIILFAYIIDWVMGNINRYSKKGLITIFSLLPLFLFICLFMISKTGTLTSQLNSGLTASQNQVKYLKWVEKELPENAVILAGGKSDLVITAENINRPIVYNTLWNAALLIKPNEIPGITPSDFSLVNELQTKDNFEKKKYVILEDDIDLWRERITGVVDNVFATSPDSLHADDYTIKVYKFNPALKKAIYELNIKDVEVN